MRDEIKKIVKEMTVEALRGPNGGRMPEQWEVVYEGARLSYQVEFMAPRRGYQGDTSRLTWWDESHVPVGVPGQLQWGYVDTGFCAPKYRVIGGLTTEEKAAIDVRRDELIAATGRDLWDEFDGAECPEHGRYSTCNGTRGCPSCERDEQVAEWARMEREEAEMAILLPKVRTVVRQYKGTRLFGALRRAGLDDVLRRPDRDQIIAEARG